MERRIGKLRQRALGVDILREDEAELTPHRIRPSALCCAPCAMWPIPRASRLPSGAPRMKRWRTCCVSWPSVWRSVAGMDGRPRTVRSSTDGLRGAVYPFSGRAEA